MKTKVFLDKKKGRRITVRIPAATGNLGPGLDTFGLALALYCRLTFVLLEKNDMNIPFVTFSGAVQESMPAETGQLTYKILKEVWSDDPDSFNRVRIHVDSDIPLGVGLGGGTAAILGAVWAEHLFKDRVPTAGDILSQVTKLEGQGHSETFAASLIGDFVIVAQSARTNTIIARQHHWPEAWKILAVVPSYRLNTAVSKAILPKEIKLEDGIFNMQRAALLVSAVEKADSETLKEALTDRLHETHREVLVPELALLRDHLKDDPILGCVLSGGGSSVLIIVHERESETVRQRVVAWAGGREKPPYVMALAVDRKGLQELPYARTEISLPVLTTLQI